MSIPVLTTVSTPNPMRADRAGRHALRHHYASVLLDAGESIVALSEYLGHHDPGFTLRTYTHLMDTSGDRAKKAVDEAFAKGIRKAAERPVKGEEPAT